MKVKICCHTCKGEGVVTETEYPSGKEIKVACYECDGNKYVTVDR